MVRQLALAEELSRRGHHVSVWGASDVPWALEQIMSRHLTLHAPDADDFGHQMVRHLVDVVMIDGYEIPSIVGESVMARHIPVLTMIDGDYGAHQTANVYIDQNLNATRPPAIPARAQFRGGLDYALLRDQIRSRRGRVHVDGTVPRVLVVFGGTDAFRGAEELVPLLLRTAAPVHVVAIAASDDIARRLKSLVPGPAQSVQVEETVDDLGGLAVSCQAAVSAAGTTVWELMCLGVPTGLVCVVDNQELGYTQAATTRVNGDPVCLPVARLSALRDSQDEQDSAVRQLTSLLTDVSLRTRLSQASRQLVDGEGRVRVAALIEDQAASM